MAGGFIQVFKPSLGDEELEALREVFESGWLGLGPKTRKFEEEFAAYVGASHGVATNSATAALHLACVALGIGPGDEVLVPAMTFVSTAHAPRYCGATPVFVDVEPDTLNVDVEDAARKITPRTRAIMPVHYAGHACRMDAIWELAAAHDLRVIEDAAHACGSTYRGDRIGNARRSDAVCFSFHAVKNLPVGDGGMVTTGSAELAERIEKLRWLGISKSTWDRTEEVEAEVESPLRRFASYGWYYDVETLGYKCHMNDIAAAIGLVQLGKLDRQNDRRRQIVARYDQALAGLDWIDAPAEKPYTRSSCHLYAARTPHRDALNLYLKEQRIATGVHYIPLHLHPFYAGPGGAPRVSLPVAESAWTQLITLPLYPSLEDEEVEYIIDMVRAFEPAQAEPVASDLRMAA
jgi:perosamine synthetase